MSKSREYELAIRIAGEVEKSFYESTKLTKKELQEIARQSAQTALAAETSISKTAANHSRSIRESYQSWVDAAEPAFSGLERVAMASFQAIASAAAVTGGAITAGLVASINAGSEFESAFAGVKKTVNATDAELLQMRGDIRQMATEMPVSAAELSAIAESAGQLGIQTENITAFTETMANMNVATNLTSEEAASQFAQFANITGMAQDNFDELGSSVVALGNNLATTEADIVSMGMRIAAAGDQVNLSEADIVAYAAALSSVGIEAEAGGTAFSKLLANLQLATETGDNLKAYAAVAGMTGQEFKKAFQDDATVAINAFLHGLNDTEQNGQSAIAVLEDIGLTEVQLRDTLLRAANASGMFEEALELSSTAWNENTALAREAEERYKTFESQCKMTGNKLTDIGISIYDDLRPALTEGIGLVNGFIDSMAGQEDVIGDVIESATKKMPTMVREAKETGEAVREFAEPFLAVGGWLAEHPGVITGQIAGIGTALAAYKVASGITSLTKALGALNPVGAGIMALGGVAAVITGIGTSVKKAAEDAKEANLAAHFGDISLSLSELQETAAYVVQSQNLDGVREAIAAMGDADTIADNIQSATESISKMNWKVSIGMELTEDEKETYRNQIESYINETQQYLEQNQYAVNLAVGILTDDDLEGNNIVDKVNQFYLDKSDQLADLGRQMNETITDAFSDGLLDIDEVKEITELQSQMAEIQSSLAESEFNANLELMKTKYSAGELDAESFRNLQAEIQEEVAAASADYEQAFVMAVSNADTMLREGDIGRSEYDAMVAEYQANYLEQTGELQARAADFQTQTIIEQYGIDTENVKRQVEEQLQEALDNAIMSGNGLAAFDAKTIYGNMDFGLDSSTKAALAELYEDLAPQMEQLQETAAKCREAGEQIPEYVSEGINKIATIRVLSGDVSLIKDMTEEETDALYSMMAEQAAGSEKYQELLECMDEQGIYIPEQLAAAILDNKDIVLNAVNELYNIGGQGILAAGSRADAFTGGFAASSQTAEGVLDRHADGGIFSTPHIALFAEEGPEAVIPLNGSRNAIDLWQKTGELMGMDGLTGGSEPIAADIEEAAYYGAGGMTMQIEYSPTLQFYGETLSKEDVQEIVESDEERFAELMERYLANNRRANFY